MKTLDDKPAETASETEKLRTGESIEDGVFYPSTRRENIIDGVIASTLALGSISAYFYKHPINPNPYLDQITQTVQTLYQSLEGLIS